MPTGTAVNHYDDDALTSGGIDVLRYIAAGARNKDVSDKLSISEESVKVHSRHIIEKLGAIDRTQAVAIAVRRNRPALVRGYEATARAISHDRARR